MPHSACPKAKGVQNGPWCLGPLGPPSSQHRCAPGPALRRCISTTRCFLLYSSRTFPAPCVVCHCSTIPCESTLDASDLQFIFVFATTPLLPWQQWVENLSEHGIKCVRNRQKTFSGDAFLYPLKQNANSNIPQIIHP